MVDISKPQYKMLKKLHKNKFLSYECLSDEEKEICAYLLQHNLISVTKKIGEFSKTDMILPPLKIDSCSITQSGEAQIYIFKSTFYKWWIPVIISLVALALSIASLIVQIMQI